ncbi:hypothetical protein [Rhodovulum visakhapatnamense]|uniref:Uncharacterized protein n=1 Tax=Rhodovulum visakhapatnamense TaxID=364297 RepID=A0A4V3GRL5_9RHOB|nr:hypothetical protein [Rhodovulum visakhapatnamense]TDX19623.1 hypothetical protein EV657_1588 [Rhodovulum visakhapatnamense]
MAGAAARAKVGQHRDRWLAWHVAALTRTPDFPRAEDFILPPDPKREAAVMILRARVMHARFQQQQTQHGKR